MKKRWLTLILLIACLLLSGCQAAMDSILDYVAEKASETGADALTRQFLDGLVTGDMALTHAAMTDEVTAEMMADAFDPLRSLLPENAEDYTLTPRHWSMQTDNGVTAHSFQFLMVTAGRYYIVETQQITGKTGLYHVNMQEIDPAMLDQPAEQASFGVWDALSLLLTLAVFALLLWALIDCLRHRMRRRWLWLLLILLGNLLLTFTLSGSRMNILFNIGLYLVGSQISVQAGGFGLKLVIPVGSIIYLCLRKKLYEPDGREGFSEAFTDHTGNEPESTEASHESEEV